MLRQQAVGRLVQRGATSPLWPIPPWTPVSIDRNGRQPAAGRLVAG